MAHDSRSSGTISTRNSIHLQRLSTCIDNWTDKPMPVRCTSKTSVKLLISLSYSPVIPYTRVNYRNGWQNFENFTQKQLLLQHDMIIELLDNHICLKSTYFYYKPSRDSELCLIRCSFIITPRFFWLFFLVTSLLYYAICGYDRLPLQFNYRTNHSYLRWADLVLLHVFVQGVLYTYIQFLKQALVVHDLKLQDYVVNMICDKMFSVYCK